MPTLITLFRKLANSAELEFTKQNNTETSIKRCTYYFYTYLKAFFGAAAINEGISTLNHHQAIQKITSKPTNTHHLARILIYFYLLYQPKLSIIQISAEYRDKFYPQAEKIIFEKFNIQFNTILLMMTFYSIHYPHPQPKTKTPNKLMLINSIQISIQQYLILLFNKLFCREY